MSEENYWTRAMRRRLSRRQAIIGGSQVGLGLIGASLVGCSGQTTNPTPTAAAVSTKAAGGSPAAAATPAGVQPKKGGTLKLAVPGDPVHLDPQETILYVTHYFTSLAYSRLVKWRSGVDFTPNDLTIAPDLAESWKRESDTVWTFNLRKNAKWHNVPPANGRDVTADDVIYTWKRIMDPATKSPGTYAWEMVSGIEAVDPKTVRITTKAPFAEFLNFMANDTTGWIINKETVEKNGNLEQVQVGTGPFVLKEYQRGVKAVWKRSDNYFLPGKPYLDGIEWYIMPDGSSRVAALSAGEIHIHGQATYPDVEDLKKTNPQIKHEAFEVPQDYMIWFGTKMKPADDPRVRRAISLGIDRDQVIKVALFGEGQWSDFIPPALKDWAMPEADRKKALGRDVAKAKQLLAEAGYPNGFEATINNYPGYAAYVTPMLEVIVGNLKDIGVKMNIQQMEYAAHHAVLSVGKAPFVFNPETPFKTPHEWVYIHRTGAARNWSLVSDPKLDEMIDKQIVTMDPAGRKKILNDINQSLYEIMPEAPVTAPNAFVSWQPFVKGFRAHITYGMPSIEEVWLDK